MAATLDDLLVELEKIEFNTRIAAQNKTELITVVGTVDLKTYDNYELISYEVISGTLVFNNYVLTGNGTVRLHWRG